MGASVVLEGECKASVSERHNLSILANLRQPEQDEARIIQAHARLAIARFRSLIHSSGNQKALCARCEPKSVPESSSKTRRWCMFHQAYFVVLSENHKRSSRKWWEWLLVYGYRDLT